MNKREIFMKTLNSFLIGCLGIGMFWMLLLIIDTIAESNKNLINISPALNGLSLITLMTAIVLLQINWQTEIWEKEKEE